MKARHREVVSVCEFCDYKATMGDELRSHVTKEHKGLVHGCRQCPFKTSDKQYLKRLEKCLSFPLNYFPW